MENSIDKLEADRKTIAEMLSNKYSVDYFQREYKWGRKQVEELLEDLKAKFNDYFSLGQTLEEVEEYGYYYLGSVILSKEGGKFSIIDGQQRLTTLTLLLIYLYNAQKELEDDEKADIARLIKSSKFGKSSFNMHVPDREECIKALFKGEDYNDKDANESVKNIIDRYEDIGELLSDDFLKDTLRFFTEWLINKVVMVQIVAFSDQDAYRIFETMNDRGLNLNSAEMLKGFLLSGIRNETEKNALNDVWKKNMKKLSDCDKEGDLEFFKSFLRAKFAETIRPSKKGAPNEDFEKIGTRFHSWVRDNDSKVRIESDNDIINLLKKEIPFYVDTYMKIVKAREKFDDKLPYIYYIKNSLAPSLYLPLLLAPVKIEDSAETINKKLNIVAAFLEMFLVFRSVNRKSNAQTTIRYNMYTLVKDIRNSSVKELAEIMRSKVDNFDVTLDGMDDLMLGGKNKWFIKLLLARITRWLEEQCGIESSFVSYVDREQKKPFEIEHIWPDKFEEHKDEFEQRNDFNDHRNRLGALILIQNGPNQSYNDMPYEEKVEYYYGQNLLAKTLNKKCYEKNPTFLKFIEDEDLRFQPYEHFKKKNIEERQILYSKIAKKIWNREIFESLVQDE